MRILWAKAPFVLRRHPAVLAAIVVMSLLAALAAASSPLVRAAVESESLQGQLRQMSPLAAGFQLEGPYARLSGDRARRAAATRLARTLPFVGPAVVSSQIYAQIANADGNGEAVVPLARTGALAHVHRLTPPSGDGVWISSLTAQLTHLRPGDTMRLTVYAVAAAAPPVVSLRVAGIYQRLDTDTGNPYWANWLRTILPASADSPPQPQFVLMPEQTFLRVARAFAPVDVFARYDQNRYELPVDPSGITVTGAKRLLRQFAQLRTEILRPGSPLGRSLCFGDTRGAGCATSSSLDAALAIAGHDVAAVGSTISLLSWCGIAIALALSVAAGVFLVRRRADETHVVYTRGEAAGSFAARTALEAALPAAVGAACGLGVALLALGAFAPSGTVAGDTATAAGLRALAGWAGAVVCVALGAAAAYPRRPATGHGRAIARVPWETLPLAAAAALLALVVAGGGLAHDAGGDSHPRLVVFVLPVLAAAGIAGLGVRLVRRLLGHRSHGRSAAAFLALRRLSAARGLLVAVVVASAGAFSMYAYAATLSASLDRTAGEKALVSNGSDVQAIVDPRNTITKPFRFPVAIVEVDQLNVSFPSGAPVDLIAGDPASVARTLLWGAGWGDDPRPLLRRLATEPDKLPLAAIATPGAPPTDAIVDQGKRIPVRVIGHAALPAASAGRPALFVARAALRRAARRIGFLDPGPQADGILWAKGAPRTVEPALIESDLAPAFMTTPSHIRQDPSVGAAERSYRYVQAIGLAAAVLSLVALLLYLQARQRSQLIASALVRRMGLGAGADAVAVGLEAAAIVLFAAVAGGAVATATARPIVGRVDALPLYAPAPVYVVPWTALLAGGAVAVAVAACLGALATVIAARSNVAEALRVA